VGGRGYRVIKGMLSIAWPHRGAVVWGEWAYLKAAQGILCKGRKAYWRRGGVGKGGERDRVRNVVPPLGAAAGSATGRRCG